MTSYPTAVYSRRALIMAFFVLGMHPNAQAERVTFEISGLTSDTGAVHCLLFSSAEGFPNEAQRAIKAQVVPPGALQAQCTFTDLPAGTYALSVWHDANANGRLDTNFVGMPREPVGASNNAEGRMGPPRFEAAAFKIESGAVTQRIRIK